MGRPFSGGVSQAHSGDQSLGWKDMSDPQQVDRKTGMSQAWSNHPGLVFAGIRLAWKAAASDAEFHRTLGARWAGQFGKWKAEGGQVELDAPEQGYFVRLNVGHAHFRNENEQALRRAFGDIEEWFAEGGNTRQGLRVNCEVQYVHAASMDFEHLVRHLEAKALNPALQRSLGMELEDLAYLTDCIREGRWHQVNWGPIRSHEVPRRVAALTLNDVPPVALFCSLTTRLGMSGDSTIPRQLLDSLIAFGEALRVELLS